MYQSLRTNELPDDYVVFDIETSGLNPKKDKIIEIGAIKYKDNKKIDYTSTTMVGEEKVSVNISLNKKAPAKQMPLIIKLEERFKHLDKISNANVRII